MSSEKISTKKLINSANRAVDDSLEGMALVYPGLQLLPGQLHRVVVRSDIEQVRRSGRVTLVCGGGSGHEPAHAGFVGRGMLTAAVPGGVFASPPSEAILSALRSVATTAGILVIVKNYTGDRLNFGIAIEKAKAEGIHAEMVIIGDDCALPSTSKTAGRRGLCGTIFLYKIAGAMAEEGYDLTTIYHKALEISKSIGTIGISLNPCSLPGKGPNFILASDEIELGLGIHGEAGYKRCKLEECTKLVKIILDQLSSNESGYNYFALNSGSKVILVVNNLGGLSNLEMGIVARDAIQYLTKVKQVTVEMAYMGTFMTSLEMQGVSLTLIEYTEERAKYLDMPTNAPAWPNGSVGLRLSQGGQWANISIKKTEKTTNIDVGKKSDSPQGSNSLLIACIEACCKDLINSKEYLDKLDSNGGDSDCGTTLAAGANAILESLNELGQLSYSQALLHLASLVESNMGGSSGGFYSIFFSACAAKLDNPENPTSWVASLECGINAISKYGGACKGDRTMLDALYPVLESFKSNVPNLDKVLFAEASLACRKAAEATVNMEARAGRASYVSKAQLTMADPGAIAVAIWIEAVNRIVQEKW